MRVRRKFDREERAAPGPVLGSDRATMRLDEPTAYRKSKTRSASLANHRRCSVEFRENSLAILGKKTRTVVGYQKSGTRLDPLSRDFNGRVNRAVFRGILKQIEKHMLHQNEIDLQRR
jgi:hypothetical protein